MTNEEREALGWERLNAVRIMQGDAVHVHLVTDLMLAVRDTTGRKDVSTRLAAALVGTLPVDEWLVGVSYAVAAEGVTHGS